MRRRSEPSMSTRRLRRRSIKHAAGARMLAELNQTHGRLRSLLAELDGVAARRLLAADERALGAYAEQGEAHARETARDVARAKALRVLRPHAHPAGAPRAPRTYRHEPTRHHDMFKFDADDDPRGLDPPPNAEMERLREAVAGRLGDLHYRATQALQCRLTAYGQAFARLLQDLAGRIHDDRLAACFDVVDAAAVRQALEEMVAAAELTRIEWEEQGAADDDRGVLLPLAHECDVAVSACIADVDAYGRQYAVEVAHAILDRLGAFVDRTSSADTHATHGMPDAARRAYEQTRLHAVQGGAQRYMVDNIDRFLADDDGRSQFRAAYVVQTMAQMMAYCREEQEDMRKPGSATAEERRAVKAFVGQARCLAVACVYLAHKYAQVSAGGEAPMGHELAPRGGGVLEL